MEKLSNLEFEGIELSGDIPQELREEFTKRIKKLKGEKTTRHQARNLWNNTLNLYRQQSLPLPKILTLIDKKTDDRSFIDSLLEDELFLEQAGIPYNQGLFELDYIRAGIADYYYCSF